MRAEPEQLRHAFDRPGRVQHHRAAHRVGHALVEVAQGEGKPLDGDQVDDLQAGAAELGAELARPVTVAGERLVEGRRDEAGALDPGRLLPDPGQLQW
jgi:hypothetical protein